MKINEVTLYENKSHRILQEGWHDLTESQQKYVGRWEKELWPLLEEYQKLSEATLTRDQVIDLFKGAEETAMASGDNKTLAGKVGAGALAAAKLPVDIAKAVDAKINELGRLAQQAGPVKNMDQKFDELKKKIEAENSDSKIVQGIKKVSDWAKENPGKASIAVGILTTVAAFAGGPAGGAAAGLVLRASKDLLQGEKLSTAVGKSLKVAAYGALAGMAFKELTDNMVDNIATAENAEWDAMEAAMKKENYLAMRADAMGELGVAPDALEGTYKVTVNGNLNRFYYSYDTVIPKDQLGALNAIENAMNGAKTFSPEYYEAAAKYHDLMGVIQNSPEAKNLTAAFDAIKDIPKDSLTAGNLRELLANAADGDELIATIKNAGGGLGAVVQGALATADDNAEKAQTAKPIDPAEKKQLELDLKGGENEPADDRVAVRGTESISMQERLELYLAEKDPDQGELPLDNPNTLGAKAKRGLGNLAGRIGGAVKGAAGKAAGAVKQGAKDLGNKVTANKLTKAWKDAGEPLDTGSIMNIMRDAGMTNDQIGQVGQQANVKLEPTQAGQAKQGQAEPATPATGQAEPQAGGQQEPQAGGQQEPQAEPQAGGQQEPQAEPQAGGKEKPAAGKTAKPNPKIKVAPGAGQMAKAQDGQDYVWAGQQWVSNATGKMATRAVAAELGNPTLDNLAGEIKKAGPEVVQAVIAQLQADVKANPVPKTKPNLKVAARTNRKPKPKVAPKNTKMAASIDNDVNDLIKELDRVLH
jgi:hypothetical protein